MFLLLFVARASVRMLCRFRETRNTGWDSKQRINNTTNVLVDIQTQVRNEITVSGLLWGKILSGCFPFRSILFYFSRCFGPIYFVVPSFFFVFYFPPTFVSIALFRRFVSFFHVLVQFSRFSSNVTTKSKRNEIDTLWLDIGQPEQIVKVYVVQARCNLWPTSFLGRLCKPPLQRTQLVTCEGIV